MSRLAGMTDQNSNTDVSGVTYNAANQLTGITYFGSPETRTYNSLGQMTQLWASSSVYYNYNYPTGTNNGKVSSTYEAFSGETISYTYDSLNRMATAAGSGWAETYGYDGFGNLTAKTPTAGTPPSLSQAANPANNRIVGYSYDANGNQLGAPGFTGSPTYDVENRMVAAPGVQYAYDSQNKRVWTATVDSSNNLTGQTANFYGVNGQKIGSYSLAVSYGVGQLVEFADPPANLAIYFGGKRVATTQGGTTTSYWQDRLGSNRNSGSRYYPWGEDRSTPSNDQVRFATYTRDSATLLDYADQRYYGNAQGRFMTPDPDAGSAKAGSPQSLNRYAYVMGDPTNSTDPTGTDGSSAGSAPTGTDDTDLFDCTGFVDVELPSSPCSINYGGLSGYFPDIAVILASAAGGGAGTATGDGGGDPGDSGASGPSGGGSSGGIPIGSAPGTTNNPINGGLPFSPGYGCTVDGDVITCTIPVPNWSQIWNQIKITGQVSVLLLELILRGREGSVAPGEIVAEMNFLIWQARLQGQTLTPCQALAQMMAAAKEAGDTKTMRKIRKAEKEYGCSGGDR